DGQGRTVDFRNTVVVMTSNLGSDIIQTLAGEENYEAMKSAVMGVVGNHFRPEFINRIDEVVVFHPLDRTQLRGIAEIQLGLLKQRLGDRDLHLELSDEVMDKICEAGYDPVYGARPLKRTIQQLLENPLAQAVLAGTYGPGETIKASLAGDKIVFA